MFIVLGEALFSRQERRANSRGTKCVLALRSLVSKHMMLGLFSVEMEVLL